VRKKKLIIEKKDLMFPKAAASWTGGNSALLQASGNWKEGKRDQWRPAAGTPGPRVQGKGKKNKPEILHPLETMWGQMRGK